MKAPIMKRITGPLLCSLLAPVLLVGCQRDDGPVPPVAVTNTLLAAAVHDLLGEQTEILQLAGPGMCPGHFDIRPSQLSRLRRTRILLRFDFQGGLDNKLSAATQHGLRIVSVSLPGGLCRPDSYLAACRQTADALVAAGLLDRPQADQRLAAITGRIGALAEQVRRRTRPLAGRAVIASAHQKPFCEWLGLEVVATFSGADTAGVGQLDRALRAGQQARVGEIIANRPEGRRVADALADRLGATVVVFDNFPPAPAGRFDQLLKANTDRLIEAIER
jgi:zinc transport system substrate-binding protein